MDITKYGNLRKHQVRAFELAENVIGGLVTKTRFVAEVVPGGGKTHTAAVFADMLMRAGLIDQVLYVVPNTSLRDQIVDKFHNFDRGIFWQISAKWPHAKQLSIDAAGAFRGRVVTYQRLAMADEAKRISARVVSKKTLVIFDEVHHLCVDDESSADEQSEAVAWIQGALRVGESAAFVLSMSGTLQRADNGRIPFVEYDMRADGDHKPAIVDIECTRAEALEARSILRTDFKMYDGRGQFGAHGSTFDEQLSTATGINASRALKTCITQFNPGGFVDSFVKSALSHWEGYILETGHKSCAIVVCHSQKAAKETLKIVRARFPQYASDIAISDQGDKRSRAAIARFKAGTTRILVTVKKAYEGLDIPRATHLLYLHHTRRSHGFIDQVFGRITRVDENCALTWENQCAYVFCPNDVMMREYVAKMLKEHAVYFDARVGETAAARGEMQDRRASTFTPLSGELIGVTNASAGRLSTPEEDRAIAALERAEPSLAHLPTDRKLRLIREMFAARAMEVDGAAAE